MPPALVPDTERCLHGDPPVSAALSACRLARGGASSALQRASPFTEVRSKRPDRHLDCDAQTGSTPRKRSFVRLAFTGRNLPQRPALAFIGLNHIVSAASSASSGEFSVQPISSSARCVHDASRALRSQQTLAPRLPRLGPLFRQASASAPMASPWRRMAPGWDASSSFKAVFCHSIIPCLVPVKPMRKSCPFRQS